MSAPSSSLLAILKRAPQPLGFADAEFTSGAAYAEAGFLPFAARAEEIAAGKAKLAYLSEYASKAASRAAQLEAALAHRAHPEPPTGTAAGRRLR